MSPTESPKKEAAKNPSKEDVHEQREADQPREGVVTEAQPKPDRPAPEKDVPSPQSER